MSDNMTLIARMAVSINCDIAGLDEATATAKVLDAFNASKKGAKTEKIAPVVLKRVDGSLIRTCALCGIHGHNAATQTAGKLRGKCCFAVYDGKNITANESLRESIMARFAERENESDAFTFVARTVTGKVYNYTVTPYRHGSAWVPVIEPGREVVESDDEAAHTCGVCGVAGHKATPCWSEVVADSAQALVDMEQGRPAGGMYETPSGETVMLAWYQTADGRIERVKGASPKTRKCDDCGGSHAGGCKAHGASEALEALGVEPSEIVSVAAQAVQEEYGIDQRTARLALAGLGTAYLATLADGVTL